MQGGIRVNPRRHILMLAGLEVLYFVVLWTKTSALDLGVGYVIFGYCVALLGVTSDAARADRSSAAVAAGYVLYVLGIANATANPSAVGPAAAVVDIAGCGLAASVFVRSLARGYTPGPGRHSFKGRVHPAAYYVLFLAAVAMPIGFAFSSDFISIAGAKGIPPGWTALAFLALAAAGFARLAPNPIGGLRRELLLTATALAGVAGALAFQVIGPRDWYSFSASAIAVVCALAGLWGALPAPPRSVGYPSSDQAEPA